MRSTGYLRPAGLWVPIIGYYLRLVDIIILLNNWVIKVPVTLEKPDVKKDVEELCTVEHVPPGGKAST